MLFAHLVHTLLLHEIVLLSEELVNRGGRATTSDQRVTIGQCDSGGVVEELVVGLVDCLDVPLLGVEVEHDDLVGVTKEAKLFIGHLNRPMVNVCQVLDRRIQLVGIKLDLRVSHGDRHQLFRDGAKLVCLPSKILQSICDVSTFDLLAPEVVDLDRRFLDVFLTKVDHLRVLLKVLLLPRYPSLFNFQSLAVLQLDLCLLELDLLDHFVEVVVDLAHYFNLALLDLVL